MAANRDPVGGRYYPRTLQEFDDFAFRFDHRHSRARGPLVHRLVQQAAQLTPVPVARLLAGNPKGIRYESEVDTPYGEFGDECRKAGIVVIGDCNLVGSR